MIYFSGVTFAQISLAGFPAYFTHFLLNLTIAPAPMVALLPIFTSSIKQTDEKNNDNSLILDDIPTKHTHKTEYVKLAI